jgi:selenocysteine-specific elongation factor
MKRIVIGTAGHIDHGKTTLIKSLTGIDCDRLKEEKERGITTELGFAHYRSDDGLTIGIVDVPGHEKFIRHMVAGHGIRHGPSCVAADEGVMPHTREHVDICELLGLRKGIVAITKTDLVDEEMVEMAKEDVPIS